MPRRRPMARVDFGSGPVCELGNHYDANVQTCLLLELQVANLTSRYIGIVSPTTTKFRYATGQIPLWSKPIPPQTRIWTNRLVISSKYRFDVQSETYQQFLQVLRDYYDAFRSDIEEVVAKHKATKSDGVAKMDGPEPDATNQDIRQKRDDRTLKALEDVKKLFKGHDDLIKGFEAFLPESQA
ncbi:hypothetical protein BJ170DRAFT_626275 [Xylariales sp. AK1849]|nr:hypothetical protein BJ170DRAFT_626275 [Xylariales sp. AK1849]